MKIVFIGQEILAVGFQLQYQKMFSISEYKKDVERVALSVQWKGRAKNEKYAKVSIELRPRRNGQNFRSVFLMLNYTDMTQNTYIQSWTVTEIMAWEKCGHLAFPRTVRLQLSCTDLDSTIKAVISVTARAPPNAIRQYFIKDRYSCATYSAW